MPQRITDSIERYTQCDPNGIVIAPLGTWFLRDGTKFFISLPDSNSWIRLEYRTVTLPAPGMSSVIQYLHDSEMWLKESGNGKTGWKFKSYGSAFSSYELIINRNLNRNLNWIDTVPTGSGDSVGEDLSRAYDSDYFYFKANNVWKRTPLETFTFPETADVEQPSLYNSLPYVVDPRYLPVPNDSSASDVQDGEQTYDDFYFYIKDGVTWKRTPLQFFISSSKMSNF